MRSQQEIFCFTLSAMLFVLCSLGQAQQRKNNSRIGYLSVPKSDANLLQEELRKLGYSVGNNIVIEYRHADGKHDRLPALANELVRLDVDVLVASSTTVALAAKHATQIIPIVFLAQGDPVAAGLVASLPRPGPKSHRIHAHRDDIGWKTIGAAQTNHSQTLACSRAGGIPATRALRKHGKKPAPRRRDSLCNFILWR